MTDAELVPNPDTTGTSNWRRAMRFERGIYANLIRWIRHRPNLDGEHSLPVPYVDIVKSTIWLWIGASALEMAVVHYLVPWPWVRWPLLLVSIWGLLWMVGLLAGLVVYPHLLSSDSIHVRNGHTIEVLVPIDNIMEVRTHTRSLMESRTVQLDPDNNQHLIIAMSSQVNIHVTLIDPQIAQLPGGKYTFTSLSFWADDTRPALSRLRELINGSS